MAQLMAFALLPSMAMAGGFVCDLQRECVNDTCQEVAHHPYIDTDWGQIVIKGFGPEINLAAMPQDVQSDTWKLFAHLPAGGLLVTIINQDSSAVFTTFGHQGGTARVVSTFGTCESRG